MRGEMRVLGLGVAGWAAASSAWTVSWEGRPAGSLTRSRASNGCSGPASRAGAGGVLEDSRQSRRRIALPKRRSAFDGGVKGHSERPEVGWGARCFAADEFGRHVRRGADDDVTVPPGPPGGVAAGGFGYPEVDQHQSAVVAEEQVRGFHVAVHDAGVVHRLERGEQLQAERGDYRRR